MMVGYTGLVSFGHAAWFGIGAYVAALVQLHWLPDRIILPVLAGMAVVAVLSTLVGALMLRRRGVYFALMTLALSALASGFLGPVNTLITTAMQLQQLRSYMARIEDVLDSPTERRHAVAGDDGLDFDGGCSSERQDAAGRHGGRRRSVRRGPADDIAAAIVDDVGRPERCGVGQRTAAAVGDVGDVDMQRRRGRAAVGVGDGVDEILGRRSVHVRRRVGEIAGIEIELEDAAEVRVDDDDLAVVGDDVAARRVGREDVVALLELQDLGVARAVGTEVVVRKDVA